MPANRPAPRGKAFGTGLALQIGAQSRRVTQILFAVIPVAETTAVIGELTRRGGSHRPFAVYEHCGGALDSLALPTSATEVGKNTAFAAIFGAVAGGVLGLAMGASELILGLNLVMGALLGLIFGGLVGILCGMMAGTRRPKPELEAAAAQANREHSLLIVEIHDDEEARHINQVTAALALTCTWQRV